MDTPCPKPSRFTSNFNRNGANLKLFLHLAIYLFYGSKNFFGCVFEWKLKCVSMKLWKDFGDELESN